MKLHNMIDLIKDVSLVSEDGDNALADQLTSCHDFVAP
jgi:hypothetical protein